MILTLLICFLVADFITGLGHWIEDTYAVKTWPWPLLDGVVLPNIEHHKNPTFIGTMSTLISRNWHLVVPAVIVSLVFLYFGIWQVAVVLVLASLGNEVHAWNHRRTNNFAIAFLQDAGIIQTPQQHAKHHKQPYDKYYCTLGNITNAVLEQIRFWKGLEYLLSKIGIHPKRMTESRDWV